MKLVLLINAFLNYHIEYFYMRTRIKQSNGQKMWVTNTKI